MTEITSIKGTLYPPKYHQNNWYIGQLKPVGAKFPVTVVGTMLAPQPGLEYTLTGSWTTHEKFGKQFKFTDYEAHYPTDVDSIREYLIETAKWMGCVTAQKVVDKYGEDTLRVLKHEAERVAADIPGITIERAREVSASLRNSEHQENLRIALKEILGGTPVTSRSITKIIELWDTDAPTIIRENPYRMIDEIPGVGFPSADQVALKIGFEHAGAHRVHAGILHALKESAWNKGHVYLPERVLISETASLLALPASRIEEELGPLAAAGKIVRDGTAVYMKKLRNDECAIAEKLKALASCTVAPGNPDLDGLQADQIDAVKMAVLSPVFILTGGPGTGKTFTIKRIISSFRGQRIKLAAPTGKAAKRMIEQTGELATTVHRLLGPEKTTDGWRFAHGPKNPIPADVVILDETSMLDVSLAARVIEAIAPGTRLILIGDTYQLPAVGPGSVLRDLIASGAIPSVELTVVKRQDPGLIVTNCHRVKAGLPVEADNGSTDFFILERDTEQEIQQTILDLVLRRLPAAYGLDPLRDIQVISPVREKSSLSCKALNELFQEKLFPGRTVKGSFFRVGDKVIQTKNDYDLDILNGDIGYIRDATDTGDYMDVEFEGGPAAPISIKKRENELALAYCITCHKFQGSGARAIIIPMHSCFGGMILQRNWTYTAISRAREVCIIVGQVAELQKSIRRVDQTKRHTKLKEMLA